MLSLTEMFHAFQDGPDSFNLILMWCMYFGRYNLTDAEFHMQLLHNPRSDEFSKLWSESTTWDLVSSLSKPHYNYDGLYNLLNRCSRIEYVQLYLV